MAISAAIADGIAFGDNRSSEHLLRSSRLDGWIVGSGSAKHNPLLVCVVVRRYVCARALFVALTLEPLSTRVNRPRALPAIREGAGTSPSYVSAWLRSRLRAQPRIRLHDDDDDDDNKSPNQSPVRIARLIQSRLRLCKFGDK